MYLSKLELIGFKSFAQKTVLTFPKLEIGQSNITAIVGPNGSGKSNVADSIRWVTGEQSLKSLRGKKSEDVIFSGTHKKARLGAAEVSLYLDNNDCQVSKSPADKASPVDYPELIITRKLYRNGESEYLINKTKARLNDILILMAELSFGQKSYSVIGQGMTDSILLASPQERKEFLNEAAGIKQYQLKRNQAFTKLEATKENLKQAGRLLVEITPRLRSLTRQVKKLEKREEIERELHQLQMTYYGALWQTINTNGVKEKQRLDKVTADREEAQNKARGLEKQLEGLAQNTVSGDRLQKLQQNYYALNATKNKFLQNKSLIESGLIIQKEKNKLQKQVASRVSLSREEAEELLTNLKIIKKLQQELVSNLKAKNEEQTTFLSQRISKKIEKLIKIIQGGNQNEPESEAQKADATLNIKKKELELENLEQEIISQDEELKKARAALTAFSEEHRKERESLLTTQERLQKLRTELNELLARENEIKIQIARTETKKENLEVEIRKELGTPDKLARQSVSEKSEQELEGVIRPKIDQLKHQLEFIGGIDKEVLKEYEETRKRYDFLTCQISDLTEASKSLEKLIKKLEEIIKTKFVASFEKINQEFQKFFKVLFGGGLAKLIFTREIIAQPQPDEVINPQDNPQSIQEIKKNEQPSLSSGGDDTPASIKEGVEIEACPPGKKLKSISMLSGGERALTSIALICAIIANNPSPFVILDEVDAALDEANSVRFAEILEKLSHKTQFIVISHNRATMEKARILYGITMGDDGVSKLLSIKFEEIKT